MSAAAGKQASGTGKGGRYFFAVWPDGAVRDRLVEWSESITRDERARPVAGSNLHVTLVFLGALDPPQLAAVRRLGDDTAWRGASLVLDRIGYWKRPRIIWAGPRDGSQALAELAGDLRGRLRRMGFRVEERPFVPHVTLYRKAQRRPKWRPQSVEWRIDEFCLVESRLSPAGAHYEVLHRWSANGDMK